MIKVLNIKRSCISIVLIITLLTLNGFSNFSYGDYYEDDKIAIELEKNYMWDEIDGGFQNNITIENIKMLSDGGILGIGSGDFENFLFKLDSNGELLWKTILGLGFGSGQCVDLIEKDDGGYILLIQYFAGSAEGMSEVDWKITSLDSLGNEIKSTDIGGRIYGTSSIDSPSRIIKSSDGGYIVVGSSSSTYFNNDIFYPVNQGHNDIWILKLDSNLDRVWLKGWGSNNDDKGFSVRENANGEIIVLGNSVEVGGDSTTKIDRRYDLVVLKYDRNGNLLTEKKYGTIMNNNYIYEAELKGIDIEIKDDGGHFVVAESNNLQGGDISSANGGIDIWILNLDSNFNLISEKSWGSSGNESPKTIEKSEDGGFFIGFDSDSTSSYSDQGFWVIKVDANGNKTWSWNYGTDNSDDIRQIRYIGDGKYIFNAKLSNLSKLIMAYPGRWSYLKELKIAGASLSGFSYDEFNYNIELPLGITDVPTIEALAYDNDVNVVIEKPTSLPGTGLIKLESSTGQIINTYNLNFTLEKNHNAYASSIKIGGQQIDGFDKGKFDYNIALPIGTKTIPTIEVETEDSNASHEITGGTSLPGIVNIKVIAEDGVVENTYNLNLSVLKSENAYLSELKSNGIALDGFSKDKYDYIIELPYDSVDIPNVSAVTEDINASYKITKTNSLPGTTTIDVLAEDQTASKRYNINYVLGKSEDAYLSDIRIDEKTVSEFVYDKYNYTVDLPYGTTTVPIVDVSLKDSKSTYRIENASDVSKTTNIIVTAEDNKTIRSYQISFRIAKNNNSKLKSIKINGNLIEGFISNKYDYDINLPFETKLVPNLEVELEDLNASLEVINGTVIPSTTIINTIAEDGITKSTYRINFYLGKSDNANIKSISLNGSLIEGFSPQKYYYPIEFLTEGAQVPDLKIETENENAIVNIIRANQIPGKTRIEVKSESGNISRVYEVEFLLKVQETTSRQNDKTEESQEPSNFEVYNENLSKLAQNDNSTDRFISIVQNLNSEIETSNDNNEVVEYTIKSIEIVKDILEEKEEQVEIKDATIKLAERVIEKISKIEIQPDNIVKTGSKAEVTISSKEIEDHISIVKKEISQIQDKMKDAIGEDWASEVKQSISIKIPNEDKQIKEIKTNFNSEILKEIEKNNIDSITFDLDIAGFSVSSDTFAIVNESTISLKASLIQKDDVSIPKDVRQIEGMPVFEVEAEINQVETKNFNKPMEVYFNISNLNTSNFTKEDFDSLSVYIFDEDDKEWKSIGGKYDPITKRMNVYRIHLSSYTVMKSDKSFSDIKENSSKKEIEVLLKKGILDDSDAFMPSKEITRGEFVSWMSKAFGIEEKELNLTFNDLKKTDPYYKEIAGAYKQGLVKGRDTAKFDSQSKITSQEAAAILSKAMEKYEKIKPPKDTQKYLSKLEKNEEIASWAKSAVASVERKNMGVNKTAYNPNKPMTKEDAALMIYNVYDRL